MSKPPRLISTLPHHQPIAVNRLAPCKVENRPMEGVIHDHSGIGLYLSGSAQMWMRREYTLQRGDLALIPEGMAHYTTGASDADMLAVQLCTACMKGPWGDGLRDAFGAVRKGGIAVYRLGDAKLGEATHLIEALAAELSQRRAHQALVIDGLMCQLTALILRSSPVDMVSDLDAGCPQVVSDALAYIEANAAGAISLREVAQAVCRSPAHLADLMKQHTGRTVVAWITHGRMTLARQLLLTTDAGIEAIADDVGYASPSHFYRTFRRVHQATPGAWRKAHRRATKP